jgi:hypothetical protein
VKKTKLSLKKDNMLPSSKGSYVYNKYHAGVAGATSLCLGTGQILPGTEFLVSVSENDMPPFLKIS